MIAVFLHQSCPLMSSLDPWVFNILCHPCQSRTTFCSDTLYLWRTFHCYDLTAISLSETSEEVKATHSLSESNQDQWIRFATAVLSFLVDNAERDKEVHRVLT